MQVLLTNPEVDPLTYCLSVWTDDMLEKTKSKTNQYYRLKREKVNRKEFESYLEKRSIDLVLICGHGASDAIAGDKEIILDTKNDNLLKGKLVHALSCQSAKQLGPDAMKKGAKGYIGYKENFIAFFDDSKRLTEPLKDDIASLFLDPAFTAPKVLLKGGTPKKAVVMTKKAYNKSIREAINSDIQSDADQLIGWLFWDRDNLVACEREGQKDEF